MADEEDAFGIGHAQFAVMRRVESVAVAIDFVPMRQGLPSPPGRCGNSPASAGIFAGFLERAPDAHGFAHALHLRGELGRPARILEGEAAPSPPRSQSSAQSSRAFHA